MIKNILLTISSIFTAFFFYTIIENYFSENNTKKIKQNRLNYKKILENKNVQLPYLKNDTGNIIEFNSGYTENKTNTNRSFWELFKK